MNVFSARFSLHPKRLATSNDITTAIWYFFIWFDIKKVLLQNFSKKCLQPPDILLGRVPRSYKTRFVYRLVPHVKEIFLLQFLQRSWRDCKEQLVRFHLLGDMHFGELPQDIRQTLCASIGMSCIFQPKVILQTDGSITMPMMVANLLGGYSVDYGMLMLGVLICTLPTAIIFFLLQKNFAEGITGAIK